MPSHAEQMEAVSQLFDGNTFVESIDLDKEKEDERACFCGRTSLNALNN